MALKYFVIFICAISTVFCDQCILGDDRTTIYISTLYLLGFAMLLMLVIIIYLCFALYKLKHSLICENKTKMNMEQYRIDVSTQTIYSGLAEIKELNDPTVTVCIEENKTPVILKKNLAPKMEIIPKQQMDKIITKVLNRRPRTESGTFRDLIALTKRKSSDLGANKILFNRKLNANKTNTKVDVKVEEELYVNSSMKDDTALNSNIKAVDKTINKTNLLEKKVVPDGTADKSTKTIDKVDSPQDKVPKSIPDEIHGTSPNPVEKVVEVPNVKIVDVNDSIPSLAVKVDDIYDVVPNPVLKVDNIYGTVSNIVVKVDDVYDTVPNRALKVDDLYDTVPNIVVKVDEVYDTVPEQIKREKNTPDDMRINIPHFNIVPSSSKEKLRAKIARNFSTVFNFSNDIDYALLVNENES